jgi:hypothetical protein
MITVRERPARVHTGSLSPRNKVDNREKRFNAFSRPIFKAQIRAIRRRLRGAMAGPRGHSGSEAPAHLFSKFISLYAMDFCGRTTGVVAAGERSTSNSGI